MLVSIRNLMTFPFVQAAVERGELSLHGLLHDISEGTLLQAEDSGATWTQI